MKLASMVLISMTFASAAAAAPTAAVVYSFRQSTGDTPGAALLKDGRGYITTAPLGGVSGCKWFIRTQRCGTVIRLLPPDAQHATWHAKDIYRFQRNPDGAFPYAAATPGLHGNLFLTTALGGSYGYGTVIELSPPLPGSTNWTETVIHSFNQLVDGSVPFGRPYLDSLGNVFVTANAGGSANDDGSVVEFSPPAAGQTAWTENVLHVFNYNTLDGAAPAGGLRADARGNLYLTTQYGGSAPSYGSVIELSPPANGTTWSEKILYAFQGGTADGVQPASGLLADAQGNFYGTTVSGGAANAGIAYELSPGAGGTWTEKVLYSFTGGADGGTPSRGLLLDAAGNLFVTTTAGGAANAGTLAELSPPQGGGTAWTETTLYTFPGGAGGAIPGVMTVEDNGNLLIPTQTGGAYGTGALVEVSGTGYVLK